MPYDPKIHHRRSIRLQGYDYALPGVYFVTFNTYKNEAMLGEIHNGVVRLTRYGQIVQHTWLDLPHHQPHVRLDEFIVMPQHVHGIIVLVEDVGAQQQARASLSEIIRAAKSFSSRQINALRHTPGIPVWQRNYYEHIIRDEQDLARIRQYIRDNPMRAEEDS